MSKRFQLLFKKNLKTEIRSWYFILLEVFIVGIIIAMDIFDPIVHENCTTDMTNMPRTNISLIQNGDLYRTPPHETSWYDLYYTSENTLIDEFMSNVSMGLLNLMAFENAKSMEQAFLDKEPMAGIHVHDISKTGLSFTLYSLTQQQKSHLNMWSLKHVQNTETLPYNGRINTKLLLLQHNIYLKWLELYEPLHEKIPRVRVELTSMLDVNEPCKYFLMSNLSWFCYSLIFIGPFLIQIWRYSKELEDNIYCHQWMYGLKNGHHWCAHFLASFIHLQILNICIIIFYVVLWSQYANIKGNQFTDMSTIILLLIVILLLHNIMLILSAMITAIIFQNAQNAVLFGITIWFATYGLFIVLLSVAPLCSWVIFLSFLLFFNNILPYELHLLNELYPRELKELLIVPIFSIVYIGILLFIFELLNYWFLYNSRESRRFSCLSIPCNCRKVKKPQENLENKEGQLISKITKDDLNALNETSKEKFEWFNTEKAPLNATEVLSLKHVFTYYDKYNQYPQLRDVTMNIYKGEISVILGSESLAKKAFIEILAGWRKYDGAVYFNKSMEIHENINEYKHNVDVCMETNPLFGALTLKETLLYFSLIKRQSGIVEKDDIEVDKWLNVLKKCNINNEKRIIELSYSQKHLVALCCTLCTETPIILLVEPTSRMNALEQALYWQILRHEKPDRTIIVTTHSLDEAEKIGDRIGILTDGYVVAWGTQLFLKKTFNPNYYLVVIKDPKSPVAPITELILSHFSDATFTVYGNKIIYKLPSDRVGDYQKALIDLEKNAEDFGINNARLEGGDLRDVLRNLSTEEKMQEREPDHNYTIRLNEPILQDAHRHAYPMLYKKALTFKFNINIMFIILSVAIIFIILIHIMTKYMPVFCYDAKIETLSLQSFATKRERCPYIEVDRFSANDASNSSTKQNFEYYICVNNSRKENLGLVEFNESEKSSFLYVSANKERTLPLALNLLEYYTLSNLHPNKNYSIDINLRNYIKADTLEYMRPLRLILTLGIILPIISSMFIMDLITEWQSGFVVIQKLAGLNMGVFWLMTFLCDQLIYVVIIVCCFLLMLITTLEDMDFDYALFILLIMYLYSLPALLINYFVAQFITFNKYKAYFIIFNIHIITGLCAYVFYVDVWLRTNIIHVFIFIISPMFAVLTFTDNFQYAILEESSVVIWDNKYLYVPLICMGVTALVFALLLPIAYLFRSHYNICMITRLKKMQSGYYPYDDDAVIAEKTNISKEKSVYVKTYNVVVDQLEGSIPKKGTIVNSVSFKVDKHTCFCIYGSHNSGKSHLVRQIVGDEKIYFGDVYICKANVKRETQKARAHIGYCPQEGGLLEVLTPYQLLKLLYDIYGVSKSKIEEYIRKLAVSFNLLAHLHKPISYLPYNIKRRLNVAVCLMGHNTVLIFDEPTKGLPSPDAKFILNIIKYARHSDKSVILVSNDNYECESIADTIMMVGDGAMLALGTYNELTENYTTGFYLDIELNLDGDTDQQILENLEKDVQNLSRFVNYLQDQSELVRYQKHILRYYVPVENITYSMLLGSMEKNRTRLNIKQYTIHLGNLLDVMKNVETAHKNKKKFTK